MTWIKLVAAIALAEAVVEILVDSDLFDPLRRRLAGPSPKERPDTEKPKLREILFWCGYCISVWVGVGVAVLLRLETGLLAGWGLPPWLEWVAWGLVVHRLSNIWHEALSRWFYRVPWRIVIQRPPEPPASRPDT